MPCPCKDRLAPPECHHANHKRVRHHHCSPSSTPIHSRLRNFFNKTFTFRVVDIALGALCGAHIRYQNMYSHPDHSGYNLAVAKVDASTMLMCHTICAYPFLSTKHNTHLPGSSSAEYYVLCILHTLHYIVSVDPPIVVVVVAASRTRTSVPLAHTQKWPKHIGARQKRTHACIRFCAIAEPYIMGTHEHTTPA